jgi:hypothetical protein
MPISESYIVPMDESEVCLYHNETDCSREIKLLCDCQKPFVRLCQNHVMRHMSDPDLTNLSHGIRNVEMEHKSEYALKKRAMKNQTVRQCSELCENRKQ